MKRFSILTASFGEGHNTASRNMREALLAEASEPIEVEICDLYQRTNPRLNRGMQSAYTIAINRFPNLWNSVFKLLGVRGFIETMLPTLGSLREEMRAHFREFRPTCIVSTYPIYSFLVKEIKKQSPFFKAPLVTVITDSTRINSAWYRCASDAFVLTDTLTADLLIADGADPARLHVLGFPISPRFAHLTPVPDDAPGPPHKVFFMPSTRRKHTIECLSQLLRIPNVEITVSTGNHQELYQAIDQAGFTHTPHVRVLQWTDKMPELLAESHLFIGKAGGAVVQEAIAARLPFVISHIVPGQEEGNVELIEKFNIGKLAAESPTALANAVQEAFADDARLWRLWKTNLAAISNPNATQKIAQFLLTQ